MKSKALVVMAIVGALVIGFFAGGASASWILIKTFENNFIYLDASNKIFESVKTLTSLQNGKKDDALAVQEIVLDGALITFSGCKLNPNDPKDVGPIKSIRAARDYRLAHPYSGSPIVVSNAIQQVFSAVK